MKIIRKTIEREGHKIYTKIFEPRSPVMAVQVMHGMAEHMERYDEFNTWLCMNDIYVVTHNHRGHGEHAEILGHFDDFNDLINDALLVKTLIPEHLKTFILGHSMGSVVARRLLEQNTYDGGIIVGTGNNDSFGDFFSSIFLNVLSKAAPDRRSPFIQSMAFGPYDKKFSGETKNRWLSKDEENVSRYNADAYCGHLMSINAFSETLKHINLSLKHENLKQYDSSVPILLIGGKRDPFSNMGRDIRNLSKVFIRYTDSVTVQLYEGSRHEVLNEENRVQVYNKLLEWVMDHV